MGQDDGTARHEPPDVEITAVRVMAEHNASFDRPEGDGESGDE